MASSPLVDRAYRGLNRLAFAAARSGRLVHGAAFVGRQCDRFIGYHVAPFNTDPGRNGERWLLTRVAPHLRRFIDVGANVGDWSAAALELAPSARGIAVEPGEEAVARLRARLPDLEIVTAAAGARSGRSLFFEQSGAGELSSMVRGNCLNGGVSGAYRDVEVVTIDQLLERYGWDSVDFVKIDAEGYDAYVLRGAEQALAKQQLAVVQFEYNQPWAQAGSSLGGVLAQLSDAGYVTGALGPEGSRRYDYGRLGEFYRYSNFVAVSPRAVTWL
jgi:FkbM family methyltransferase